MWLLWALRSFKDSHLHNIKEAEQGNLRPYSSSKKTYAFRFLERPLKGINNPR